MNIKAKVKDYNYYVNKFIKSEVDFKSLDENKNTDYLEAMVDPEEIAGYYLEQYKDKAFYQYSKNTANKKLKTVNDLKVYEILSNVVRTLPGYKKTTLLERYLEYSNPGNVKNIKDYSLNNILINNDIDMYVGLYLILYRLDAFKELERSLNKKKTKNKDIVGADAYAYIVLSELEK